MLPKHLTALVHAALDSQAISNYLLGSVRFVVTNKVIFIRNLYAKY